MSSSRKTVAHAQLVALQRETERIRNICILAHVDHGKTTLADGLIVSNGLISERMAGHVRFMDTLEEEQLRGITMKSSAISLQYEYLDRRTKTTQPYLINLIDSPGHVDFSSDVSTAVRVCDGALVVVDVVEGVCVQTQAVLRQAWDERVRPCLVLNKIDRLIKELQLTPAEAYAHMCRLLEQINAVVASLFVAEAIAAEGSATGDNFVAGARGELHTDADGGAAAEGGLELVLDEEKEAAIFFAPERGNVVFASAFDGWAFSLEQFARLHAKALGIRPPVLKRVLWGDYCYNAKTSKVEALKPGGKQTPMAVQFVLNNIWAMYESSVIDFKPKKFAKMAAALGVTLTERETMDKDPRNMLQTAMRRWLPVNAAVLSMVVRVLPSPREAQLMRVGKLLPSLPSMAEESLRNSVQRLQGDFAACSTASDAQVLVFITKMVAVPRSSLPQAGSYDTDEVFIAFARVFSGVLREDSTVYVLSPKHDPMLSADRDRAVVARGGLRLYLMMGQALLPVPAVPAGNVVGIGGLAAHVLKTSTLCSTPMCPSLSRMPFQAAPIVRVAVEPEDPMHLAKLERGLRLLNQADPCVEVRIEPSGEHVVLVVGELHLERCLQDLRTRFAKIPIQASPPIVSFRETLVVPETSEAAAAGAGASSTAADAGANVDAEGMGAVGAPAVAAAALPSGAHPFDGIRTTTRIALFTANQAVRIVLRVAQLPDAAVRAIEQEESRLKEVVEALAEWHDRQRQERSRRSQHRRLQELQAHEQQAGAAGATGAAGAADAAGELAEGRGGGDEDGPASVPRRSVRFSASDSTAAREAVAAAAAEDAAGAAPAGEDTTLPALLRQRTRSSSTSSAGSQYERDMVERLRAAFREAGGGWEEVFQRIWCFGPRRVGTNLLVNNVVGQGHHTLWREIEAAEEADGGAGGAEWLEHVLERFENSIVAGFQLAALNGPLCEEPMHGVCFIVDDVSLVPADAHAAHAVAEAAAEDEAVMGGDARVAVVQAEASAAAAAAATTFPTAAPGAPSAVDPYGPLSGQIMSATKDACRRAFLRGSPRLVEAMYRCRLQCTSAQLGKLYGVLSQRRGTVLSEELWEGTDMFTVDALLPVVESFGFAETLRKKTSGAASSPQLVFSHWAILDMDPFFQPKTAEEREELGEKVFEENIAKQYVDQVRRRKGIVKEERTVVHAEKQRTRARKK